MVDDDLPWRVSARAAPDFWDGLRLLPGSIWLPIIAISLLGTGVFFFNEWSVNRIRLAGDELSRTLAMETELAALRSRISEVESAQRGYLLTGNPRYLEPIDKALRDLPVINGRLRSLAQGDDQSLALIGELEEIRGAKVAEMTTSIELMRIGNREQAFAMLRTGEGRKMMDQFRERSQVLHEVLQDRLTKLGADQMRSLTFSRYAFAALSVLTFLLILLVIRLFIADAIRREEARFEEEHERRRLEVIIQDRTRQLSRLTTHLQNVSEQEKADLARDLHDELGGLLTAAKMDLAWLQGRSMTLEPEFREKLDVLMDTLTESMQLKRRVVENLRPALLDHFGLPTALQAYFDETCKRAGLHCTTTIPEEFDQIPQELAIALFRVGQESLTNIIRHAKAKNVVLNFEVSADRYEIRIDDDGQGMDPDVVRTSHGLSGMRHRVESLHGTFDIDSSEGKGTRIRIRVPRAEAA